VRHGVREKTKSLSSPWSLFGSFGKQTPSRIRNTRCFLRIMLVMDKREGAGVGEETSHDANLASMKRDQEGRRVR
jgi:hypothetical protein